MSKLLAGRNAIIYGGGGGIGGGSPAPSREKGARLFLVGRTPDTLDSVATDIAASGGSVETAVLDALDERAVDEHVRGVVSKAGSVDVSFNLISRGDVQGTPLVEMNTDDLLRAVVNGLQSNFLTARAAARYMIEQRSAVILHLNSASGAGAMPGMGSTGPADAATEAFMRYLAAEVGPHDVRVCGIWTAGVAETLSKEKSPGSVARTRQSRTLPRDDRGDGRTPPHPQAGRPHRGGGVPRVRPSGGHDRIDGQRHLRARAQMTSDRTEEIVASAIAGDEAAFAALTDPHRRELHLHCYCMLASFDEAEDAVQETFLRAWRNRGSFAGGSPFGAWLYRIATNVCLDMTRAHSRRVGELHSTDDGHRDPDCRALLLGCLLVSSCDGGHDDNRRR